VITWSVAKFYKCSVSERFRRARIGHKSLPRSSPAARLAARPPLERHPRSGPERTSLVRYFARWRRRRTDGNWPTKSGSVGARSARHLPPRIPTPRSSEQMTAGVVSAAALARETPSLRLDRLGSPTRDSRRSRTNEASPPPNGDHSFGILVRLARHVEDRSRGRVIVADWSDYLRRSSRALPQGDN